MPAIMMLRAINNSGWDDDARPGVWRAGEIVNVFEADVEFGFLEMPLNAQGQRTVAQVNGTDVSSLPKYAATKMLDAGTITTGITPIDVEVEDVIVYQNNGEWTNFGDRDVIVNDFYHIEITDKTVDEVNLYMEMYNKKLSYASDQFDPATDMRRFTTTNERVSASGNNGFTAQGIQDAIDTWNTNNPANTVTLVDTDNLTYFQVDGIMPNDLFDEWRENTQAVALSDYYRRRRWYINQQGLNALAANDGFVSGPASSVAVYLRDGLLD